VLDSFLPSRDSGLPRRRSIDAWFRDRQPRFIDNRTIDQWFHDFDESKVKRDHGRFASQAGGKGGKPAAVNVRRADGTVEKVHLPDDVVKMARRLRDDPDKYFHTEGATMVPVEKLHQTRARPEGIGNAVQRMAAAYRGEYGKRGPIHVQEQDDGSFLVLDGNSTTTIATAAGWKHIPALVVPKGANPDDFLPKK
jgi:hypothetical protein